MNYIGFRGSYNTIVALFQFADPNLNLQEVKEYKNHKCFQMLFSSVFYKNLLILSLKIDILYTIIWQEGS